MKEWMNGRTDKKTVTFEVILDRAELCVEEKEKKEISLHRSIDGRKYSPEMGLIWNEVLLGIKL